MAEYKELFDWADAEDLTFALGFYLRPKRIFVNCNLGATSHRPKGKKQYTEWETGFRQNIEALASKLEMIGNN